MVPLSHKLSAKTPAFAGGESLTITPIKEIKSGGSSNSYKISFSNHLGTHVDAPQHFDVNGKSIAEYSLEDLVFTRPVLIDLPKDESQFIEREDLEDNRRLIATADMLLLRSGFQKYRDSDPEKYSTRNPGVSSEAALCIVDDFPNLRAIGFDFISTSACQHREEGRVAHRILLSNRDFFIVEDMDLFSYPKKAKRLFVVPLVIVGVDSAPCTVMVETA